MFEDTLNMFVFTIQSSQPRTQVVLGLLHISSKKKYMDSYVVIETKQEK